MPFPAGVFRGQQHRTVDQFAHLVTRDLVSDICHLGSAPYPQRQIGRDQITPAFELFQPFIELRVVGGADPQFVHRAQLVFPAQAFDGRVARVIAIDGAARRIEEPEGLGDHRPGLAEGTQKNVHCGDSGGRSCSNRVSRSSRIACGLDSARWTSPPLGWLPWATALRRRRRLS